MANLTITAASVATGLLNARTIPNCIAGEALTQGLPVYLSGDNKYYRCDANDTLAKAACAGIVLTPASTNGTFVLQTGGDIIIGATVAVGTPYYVSDTIGLICLHGDLAAASYVTGIGHAKSTTVIRMNLDPTEIQKA